MCWPCQTATGPAHRQAAGPQPAQQPLKLNSSSRVFCQLERWVAQEYADVLAMPDGYRPCASTSCWAAARAAAPEA